jgi:uncharacterized secreted protein with C-terminal beta-propeller domain
MPTHARRSVVHGPEPLETRRVLAVAPLVVRGDADPSRPDDVIAVVSDPEAPQWMQFTVNGAVVARRPAAQIGLVIVEGRAGDDVIRIDVPVRRSLFVVRGGDGDDRISVSGAGATSLMGGNGDDTIVGGSGGDRIYGNAGDDMIAGGGGRNLLHGGFEADRILGQRGFDRIVSDAFDTIEDTRQANPLVRATSLADVGRWLAANGARSVQSYVTTGISSFARGLAGSAAAATTSMAAAADHSGTNNQVAGVEEGDLVQTDGRFIYLVGDGRLRIIDAAIDRFAVLAEVPVTGDAGEIFLHGDRLTIVATHWKPMADDTSDDAFGTTDVVAGVPIVTASDTVTSTVGSPGDAASSPGGALEAGGEPADAGATTELMIGRYRPVVPEVRVGIFDVRDRTAPVLAEEMAIDGTLAAARSIDDRIHLVIDGTTTFSSPWGYGGFMPAIMPFVSVAATGLTGVASAGRPAVDPGSTVIQADLPKMPTEREIGDSLPHVRTTTPDGVTTTTPLYDVGSIHLPIRGGGDGLVTVVTFSPVDDEVGLDHAVTTLGLAGAVYASADALVIASTDLDAGLKPITTLNAFALGAEVTHLATGAVAGWLPDQFAIDVAADGSLRVVTHEGWGAQAASVVTVLERRGLDLRPIGTLAGIAPGEDLKSVRFLGDTAYVVTFEEVDPLFAIDLSDPRRPRVAGELKIPGFSTYLQAMEPGRLFGIGRGDAPGSSQVSLFDVSDMTAPRQIDTAAIVEGEGWNHSEAATEHRAFSWFPERGLLAVPFSSWRWTGTESVVDEGLRVFGVDPATGFTHVADVRQDAPVRRSLRIGDVLYSVSSAGVTANDLGDRVRTVARLDFA